MRLANGRYSSSHPKDFLDLVCDGFQTVLGHRHVSPQFLNNSQDLQKASTMERPKPDLSCLPDLVRQVQGQQPHPDLPGRVAIEGHCLAAALESAAVRD